MSRDPSLVDATVPLIALVVLIGGALALFGLDALDGPVQVALILCAMVATVIAVKNGHSWEAVEAAGKRALASVTSAVMILLSVGALIGAWNMSGTIPTLVYYGLQVLSPGWYYAAAALICGIIAMSIGQFVDHGRDDRRRPGGHRGGAGRVRRHHGGRGDLGRLPRRQALAPVGNLRSVWCGTGRRTTPRTPRRI